MSDDDRGPRAQAGVPKAMTVYGRQGSPTVTLALPFSRVEVKADDTMPVVAELAALTARLARAIEESALPRVAAAEIAAVAAAAEVLAAGAAEAARP